VDDFLPPLLPSSFFFIFFSLPLPLLLLFHLPLPLLFLFPLLLLLSLFPVPPSASPPSPSFFEAGSHCIAKAGLEFTVLLRLTWNLKSSYLSLLSAGIIGMYTILARSFWK
jgi:hypothetical protein